MVRKTAAESENKIIKITVAVQPESRSRNIKAFIGMLAGKHSTQMAGLCGSFQYEKSNSMVAEEMEEYVLASSEASDKDPGEHAPM